MNNITICVCEDDAVQAIAIESIINIYTTKKYIDCNLHIYNTGQSLLDDYTEGFVVPDIVFMDVILRDEENGIDVCAALRKNKFMGSIIFVTGTEKFAIDAFDVDARAYILKPYDKKQICNILDKILIRSRLKIYTIKNRQKITKILVRDIMYVESQNTKSIIHCDDDFQYTVYKKLSEIESELNDKHFLRCHQSYLVNMDYVAKMENEFTLENGEKVFIRKKDIKKIRKIYTEHLNGVDRSQFFEL